VGEEWEGRFRGSMIKIALANFSALALQLINYDILTDYIANMPKGSLGLTHIF